MLCYKTTTGYAKAAMTPKSMNNTMKAINEMTRPAMANPRGALNTPINENSAPKNHSSQSRMGIQQSIKPNRASTTPAVPKPLLRCGVF